MPKGVFIYDQCCPTDKAFCNIRQQPKQFSGSTGFLRQCQLIGGVQMPKGVRGYKAGKDDWKKKRLQAHLEMKKYRYYIFCEGEQTEPQYFAGFKRLID